MRPQLIVIPGGRLELPRRPSVWIGRARAVGAGVLWFLAGIGAAQLALGAARVAGWLR